MLRDLKDEGCAHSWRTALQSPNEMPPRASFRRLLAESERRPTTVFLYSVAGGDRAGEPVAIAAVSDRVTHDFPHEGFPVLARCYVRASFRGLGLYRQVVSHRIQFCRDRWGDRLRAIHIGASTPEVVRSLSLYEPLSFCRIGEEDLKVAGEVWRVQDYLASMPAFKRELEGLAPDHAQSALGFVEGRVPYSEFRSGLPTQLPQPLRQLLDLCEAIPLLH